ncbi:MAG: hypothetical protein Q8M16_16800 [Pirellulaceae bacterium]|nr:hypothetical protein [Pirellulaceae bacterium]
MNLARRQGFSYIAVLGTSLIVGTMALGSLSVLRIQSRASLDAINSIKARENGRTAVELGRYNFTNDPNWRTTFSNGQLFTNRSTGNGTMSATIQDPVDNNLGNHPHHPVRLQITANQGRAVQKFEVDIAANPVPLEVLKNAVHSWTNLQIQSTGTLAVYGAPVGINGSLTNDNVIDGDVLATAISKQGTVTGSVTNAAPILDLPADSIVTKYLEIGTEFTNRVNLIENAVIAPGFNSFAPLNSGGVYIVRPTSNMEIRNTRIHGTLIVVMPSTGHRLTIGENVFFQPAVPGYPALIVQGHLDLSYRSDGEILSESVLATNFNPAGAPYEGSSDTDTIDSYPSEIRGLIYVTRRLRWYNNGLLRGSVLSEGQGGNGIEIHGTPRVLYDPYLFHAPAPWLTKQVNMIPVTGTWKQVVQ